MIISGYMLLRSLPVERRTKNVNCPLRVQRVDNGSFSVSLSQVTIIIVIGGMGDDWGRRAADHAHWRHHRRHGAVRPPRSSSLSTLPASSDRINAHDDGRNGTRGTHAPSNLRPSSDNQDSKTANRLPNGGGRGGRRRMCLAVVAVAKICTKLAFPPQQKNWHNRTTVLHIKYIRNTKNYFPPEPKN